MRDTITIGNATTISPGVSTVMGPEAHPMGPGVYTTDFDGVIVTR